MTTNHHCLNAFIPQHAYGFVYKWTNAINGKWYIGSHKGHPNDGYVASGRALLAAMKKHGRKNFTREILYTGTEYRETEQEILMALDAAADPMSYNMKNLARGGCGPVSDEHRQKLSIAQRARTDIRTGWRQSDDAKARISEALRNRTVSDETRSKLSRKFKGRVSPMTGRSHSPETIEKMKEARAKQVYSDESRAKMRAAWVIRKARAEEGRRNPQATAFTKDKDAA